MFTGLIEEIGHVRAREPVEDGLRLEISCRQVLESTQVGDSIALNGCCLTVVSTTADSWSTHAQPETLLRTTLGSLEPGAAVNLERPLQLGARVGGHLVQGHVDTVGTVVATERADDGSVRVTLETEPEILRYVVEKGSITIDGVSLTVTVADAPEGTTRRFGVALIPHTLSVTTLGERRPGDAVNLEVDLLAKYVERLIGRAQVAQSVGGGTA